MLREALGPEVVVEEPGADLAGLRGAPGAGGAVPHRHRLPDRSGQVG